MLLAILLLIYLIVFVLLLGTFLLLDDGKESFATHMIMLGGLILWPLVIMWYLVDSIRAKRSQKTDAPMDANPWI